MCFFKRSGYTIADKDIYVLKDTQASSVKEMSFQSLMQYFEYEVGIVYKKGSISKIKAFFSKNLESEVFHSYDMRYSDMIVKNRSHHYINLGLFRIPKGTRIYTNFSEMASFAISYVGPLTKENDHFILDQIKDNGTTSKQ